MHSRVLSATTILGDPVRNSKGESLGRIDDLMVDLAEGRIAYAVLSFGGFLGLGDKLFAIPWRTLSFRPEEKGFVLDVSREVLLRAPGFDTSNWPDMNDQAWRGNIDRYYGARTAGAGSDAR